MAVKEWSDAEKGVEVRSTLGNQCKILYSGLLSKSGADCIFLHYGFGSPENWHSIQTMQMDRGSSGWEKGIDLNDNTVIFCFKDSADHWDNNNGYNWVAGTW